MANTIRIDVEELFKAGAHFGHKTSSWNPKMSEYIHSRRGGIHIIDLVLTAEKLTEALEAIEEAVAGGDQVLLVGTKRQARNTIKEVAEDTGMPYVTYRWFGGMLTNWETIKKRIERLEELEEELKEGDLEDFYTKKEVLDFEDERDTLKEKFGSIRNLDGEPAMMFVVDIEQEVLAINEARKLNIPVVGVVDTNANPDSVDYVIPANDDALKAIEKISEYVREAIQSGKARAEERKKERAAKEKEAQKAKQAKKEKKEEEEKKEAESKKKKTTKKASSKKKATKKKKSTKKKDSKKSKKSDDKKEEK